MYKKALPILVLLLMLTGVARAYDFSAVAPSGQTLYYTITGANTVSVVSRLNASPYYTTTKPTGDLVIPSSVTYNNSTYIVNAVGNDAFRECRNLTSVSIPGSVTSIGWSAFNTCSGLTTVNIAEGVTHIDQWVFAHCSSLTTVNLPESITSLPDDCFASCTSLTSITLPVNISAIGARAFYDCSGLTLIESLAEVPPTVGNNAFTNVPTDIPVYVPCNSVADYQAASGWIGFTNLVGTQCPTYSVTVHAAPEAYGLVSGTGDYTLGQTATLTATPNPGYRFVCWREADSVYSRAADTVATVTADRIFTAEFDISTVDLAITNVNLDVATSNVPQLTINVTNSGTEDLTGACCIRIFKDYLGGEIVADCAAGATSIAAGETRTLSHYIYTQELCRLGEGDSLVFEVRTDSSQFDTIATNNVAGMNIGSLFPWRNSYEYVSDTVCDSLRWALNDHLYRESGTYEYSAARNYNGGRCDSIVVLDLTVNHGYSIDTFAIELDSYNWRGNEFHIVQTTTFSSQATLPTAAGCDSTITLHLRLIPTDTVTLLINDTAMGRIELAADTIHLDTLTADFTAQDGAVLTGRYDGGQHRIYIADGATVTLAGIDIPGRDYMQANEVWNGITCLGDATLLLADGTTNNVRAYEFGAGIFVPQGNTLAIYGSTGWLNASAPSGAGIGGGTDGTSIHTTAGNIVIYGGNINARCSEGSGIGSYTGTCGDITIIADLNCPQV